MEALIFAQNTMELFPEAFNNKLHYTQGNWITATKWKQCLQEVSQQFWPITYAPITQGPNTMLFDFSQTKQFKEKQNKKPKLVPDPRYQILASNLINF